MSFISSIFNKIKNRNILYYPGCLTKSVLPEIQKNYEKILNDLGMDFIMLKDEEYCCGSPVLRAGLKKDYEEIKQKNIEIFKNHSIGLIITNCPACYNMFKFQYKLENFGIKVEHITQTIKRYKNKIKPLNKNISIAYHDPCHLGRLSDVYNEPREILNDLGYKVTELSSNREKSMCCGGGGGLVNNNPELSKKIAENVLIEVNEDSCITSPCPMCYYQFKKNAKNKNVKEFSEIILDK